MFQKIVAAILILCVFAYAQKDMVIVNVYARERCEMKIGFAGVNANECITIVGQSGRFVCNATHATAQRCDLGCGSCQDVESRPLGCLNEQGVRFSLACGKAPEVPPTDLWAKFYTRPGCQGETTAFASALSTCVARNEGQNDSGRVFCDKEKGELVSHYYANSNTCQGSPSQVYSVKPGCHDFAAQVSYELGPSSCGTKTKYSHQTNGKLPFDDLARVFKKFFARKN